MVDSTQMVEQKQKLLRMLSRDDETRQRMLVALTSDLTKVKPQKKIQRIEVKQPIPAPKFRIRSIVSTNELL